MDRSFWLDTWERGETGFHRADVNPRLLQHGNVLPAGTRVFVPLCGKSLDLCWLAEQGHEVVGIELSKLAVESFFAEHGLTPTVQPEGELVAYRTERLTIFCGDFFALDRARLGSVGCFYDRAALVALPAELRRRYAKHLANLLPEQVHGLLVAFEYPTHEMQGPPFAVDESEVRALYEPALEVEPLASYDLLDAEPRFRARGLTALRERVYAVRR